MLPLRVRPDLRERVWGGTRLTPPGTAPGATPIGEAWLAGPASIVADGPYAGTTLDELAARSGRTFVGRDARWADRFPLLAKVLDPRAWLSVQVHPDDEQAEQLEGPGAVGKTEAWYVIEAEPDAAILLGVRPDVAPDAVREAIRHGGLARLLERRLVAPGEAYLVPAGTLHAVGPDALLYELQQPSDITYRCDDWGRPPSAGRPLHVDQSLACARPEPWPGEVQRGSATGGRDVIVACDHFIIERLRPGPDSPVVCDPAMASVHLLTAVGGSAEVRGSGWTESLEPFETLIVPADAGDYEVDGAPAAQSRPVVLLARVPDPGERVSAASRPW
jgi:mannose-6-phosphate isomerase